MTEKKSAVESLVRGAHAQIVEGLLACSESELREGLEWSRAHYGKLDVERLIALALEMHEEVRQGRLQ